jgi:hypothetical protein
LSYAEIIKSMTESELYKNLGILTKGKDQWEENIAETGSNRVVRIHCLGAVRAVGRNG